MMLFLRSLVANLYFYPAMALGFVAAGDGGDVGQIFAPGHLERNA